MAKKYQMRRIEHIDKYKKMSVFKFYFIDDAEKQSFDNKKNYIYLNYKHYYNCYNEYKMPQIGDSHISDIKYESKVFVIDSIKRVYPLDTVYGLDNLFEVFFDYYMLEGKDDFNDPISCCIIIRKNKDIYNMLKPIYIKSPTYIENNYYTEGAYQYLNYTVARYPWENEFKELIKQQCLKNGFFDNDGNNKRKFDSYYVQALRAAFYEIPEIERELKEEENQRTKEKELEVKEQLKEFEKHYSNNIVKWDMFKVDDKELIRPMTLEYTGSGRFNLWGFYLENKDRISDVYQKHAAFDSNSFVIFIILLIITVLFSFPFSYEGFNAVGLIECIIVWTCYTLWYLKGRSNRYKLGWLIYLQNNYIDLCSEDQIMMVINYMNIIGTEQEVKRYMMRVLKNSWTNYQRPPNSIDQINIDTVLWKEINKREVNAI